MDHEWLWQSAAAALSSAASKASAGIPAASSTLALALASAAIVLIAFGLGLGRMARDGLPGAAITAFGLLALETARERLMVRPETASLLMLALLLTILGAGMPGLRRGLALGAVAAVWANIHPAVLLAPVVVLLLAAGDLSDPTRRGGRSLMAAIAIEPALAAAGTLVNPYGVSLWTVPFHLRGLVRTGTFFNPEWLPPPMARFPLIYLCAALVLAGAAASGIRRRGVPDGWILVAALLAALSLRQMRHMGLFAVALTFAAGPLLRAFDPRGALDSVLARPLPGLLSCAGVIVATGSVLVSGGGLAQRTGLDPGRFPVEACEEIAREAPDVRLYNDVRFGGYLLWRFYPPRKVFIDGRNEVYPQLLARLGAVYAGGPGSYEDWRRLVAEYRIEGAIVRYQETLKGVIYPPGHAGEPERRGYRAWSAYLFPPAEWALVYFDDTALVFMKRGGAGERWIARGEYLALNPEDGDYVRERASSDTAFAARLREDCERRLGRAPPSERAAGICRRADLPSRPAGGA